MTDACVHDHGYSHCSECCDDEFKGVFVRNQALTAALKECVRVMESAARIGLIFKGGDLKEFKAAIEQAKKAMEGQ